MRNICLILFVFIVGTSAAQNISKFSKDDLEKIVRQRVEKAFQEQGADPKMMDISIDEKKDSLITTDTIISISSNEVTESLAWLKKSRMHFFSLQADSIEITVNRDVVRGEVHFWMEDAEGGEIFTAVMDSSKSQSIMFANNKANTSYYLVTQQKSPKFKQNVSVSVTHYYTYTLQEANYYSQAVTSEPKEGADTLATVLLEEMHTVDSKAYRNVNKVTIDLEALGITDHNFWLYYVGFGEDVPERLTHYGLQGASGTGDPLMDYGTGQLPKLPEYDAEEARLVFSNSLDVSDITRPNSEKGKNKVPRAARYSGSDLYRIVRKSNATKYLHILNYSRFKQEKVFVKIIGFQQVVP